MGEWSQGREDQMESSGVKDNVHVPHQSLAEALGLHALCWQEVGQRARKKEVGGLQDETSNGYR